MIDIIKPKESLSYKVSERDSLIIGILKNELNFYDVSNEIVRTYFSNENNIDLDEKGFHELMIIWLEQNVFSNEKIDSKIKDKINSILEHGR